MSLNDVIKQLKVNNAENAMGHEETRESVTSLTRSFDSYLAFVKGQEGDKLEAERESRRAASQIQSAQPPGGAGGGSSFGFLAGLGGLGSILAGLTAFGAAVGGLRGWEVNAIKSLRNSFRGINTRLTTGLSRYLDDFAKATSTKFRNVLTTINSRIARFINLRLDKLGILKFEQLRDAAGRFTGERLTPLNKIGRFFDQVGEVLKPIRDIATRLGRIAFFPVIVLFEDITRLVGQVAGFANAGTMKAVSGLVGKIGSFAGAFAKILKPIGFIFSFIDGLKEAMDTEGDLVTKLTAGVARFFADFVGAPLDLLVKLSKWFLEKLGFENIAKKLDDFSIEEKIFETLKNLPKTVSTFFDTLLNTLKEALSFTIPGLTIPGALIDLPGFDPFKTPEIKLWDPIRIGYDKAEFQKQETAEYDDAISRAQRNRRLELTESMYRDRIMGMVTPAANPTVVDQSQTVTGSYNSTTNQSLVTGDTGAVDRSDDIMAYFRR